MTTMELPHGLFVMMIIVGAWGWLMATASAVVVSDRDCSLRYIAPYCFVCFLLWPLILPIALFYMHEKDRAKFWKRLDEEDEENEDEDEL